jgi:ribose 5-phosphate isomerase B
VKIAVGADHAGFLLKDRLVALLRDEGHEVEDFGTATVQSVDYPDFAERVAKAVAGDRAALGLLVCGTGTGMAIAANKVAGVRAAACTDTFCARMARAHNNANVLALGERVIGIGVAEDVLRTFLATPFEAGRHQRRVDKIDALAAGSGV